MTTATTPRQFIEPLGNGAAWPDWLTEFIEPALRRMEVMTERPKARPSRKK
jgi:hypothetical protein